MDRALPRRAWLPRYAVKDAVRTGIAYNRRGRADPAVPRRGIVAGRRLALAARLLLMGTVLLGGCQYLPALPANPFRPSGTPEAAPERTPVTAAPPSPGPAAFTPFWIKNHRITEMWSGPAGQANVTSFGPTSAQFCSFQVVMPPSGPRLYVFNPYTQNYLWIDADAIGPVADVPERRPGPKPANQNCAEVIYEG